MRKYLFLALLAAGSLSLSSSLVSAQTFERRVDRSGSDYIDFPMRYAGARACQEACGNDERCRAWTFVRPGYQGHAPRCWLKYAVPEAQGNECCVSGVMRR